MPLGNTGSTIYPGMLKGQKDQCHLFKKRRYSDVDIIIRRSIQPGACSSSDGEDSHINTAVARSWSFQNLWRNLHVHLWASQLRAHWARHPGVLRVQDAAERPDDSTVPAKFPAHMAVLSQSDYFDSQVLLNFDDGDFTSSRPTLYVTVEDASHVPAVEAIIAALYGAKDLVSKLPQHQIVHVIQYADMMQLDLVLQHAVQLLVSAAEGLTKDTLEVLCQITWPVGLSLLLPSFAGSAVSTDSMQRVLVSVLGNLETVWAVEMLSSSLLKLPLTAVKLLLASDQLQLYSEDTVMYTAARYVTAQPREQQQEACKQLSQLVRAPHLSDFQLISQAVNEDQTPFYIMQSHKPMLQKLAMLKRFGPVTASEVANLLPRSPESWQLPARQIVPPIADGVRLLWQLPVSEVMRSYNSCSENNRCVDLYSKPYTAPISGTAWKLLLQCTWDEAGKGVKMGVYSAPAFCQHGVIYKQSFRIEGPEVDHRATSSAETTPLGRGWRDLFDCGALQGPLENSAWVDKGLPVTGDIELKLTVYEVL